MNIEEMKQQNASLRHALQEAVQSLEYIETAYPQVAGKWKRIEDIRRGQTVLEATKECVPAT